MQATDILQSIFRWIHVVAGILWIGLLYFFNWVNGPFAAKLDAESKKKVVPELMPRALFWFRWGAAWTWVTGVLLLLLVFYHGGALLNDPSRGWTIGTIVMVAFTFLGAFLYDALMKTGLKTNTKVQFVVFLILIAGILYLMSAWAGFGYRGYVIHLGALFGTIMAFNVWFRIWPAQKKIITAVKEGQAPDAALVALAGMRSKQNTYMSVPLVWTMINAHTTWASTYWSILVAVVAIAWIGVTHLYKKAGKVPGF
jgi:uncharacterized membrane protein